MIIDTLVIATLLISAIIALLRGFIREILTIAGVGGGLAAAWFGGPLLAPHMRIWLGVKETVEDGAEPQRLFGILPYDVVADTLAYGLIFITIVLVLSFISHFLAETAKRYGLGAIDRTLGFIFGLLRGVLVLGLLYLPVHLFVDQETKDTYMEGSKTRLYLEKTAQTLAGLMPEETTKDLEKQINDQLGARKKLEDINLLEETPQTPPQTRPNDKKPDNAGGYDDEFRNQMDRLFEEKTQAEHLQDKGRTQ